MPFPLLAWLIPGAAAVAVIARKRPFLTSPVKGKMIPLRGNASFGVKRSATHTHQGIDIGAATGTPVYASEQGVVVHAVRVPGTPGFRGYGKVVVIRHPNRMYTLYSHLHDVNVQVGEPVTRQTQIGTVGATCDTTANPANLCGGPHLHFELSKNAYPQPAENPRMDPVPYLIKVGGVFV